MQNAKLDGLLRVVNQLSLALWCGGTVFFSFVAAPRIFSFLRDRLPAEPLPGVSGVTSEVGRRLAGATVATIFPLYFAGQIVLGLLVFGTGLLLAQHGEPRAKLRNILIGLALAIVSVHAVTVYPKSSALRSAHYRSLDAGAVDDAAQLNRQFAIWHGVSQVLNLTVTLLAIGALVASSWTRPAA